VSEPCDNMSLRRRRIPTMHAPTPTMTSAPNTRYSSSTVRLNVPAFSCGRQSLKILHILTGRGARDSKVQMLDLGLTVDAVIATEFVEAELGDARRLRRLELLAKRKARKWIERRSPSGAAIDCSAA
jgi:hypothetical protein